MAKHVRAMVGFMDAGAEVFDYGNSIREEARLGGFERAFEFPGFVPAYIRPLFCEGKGPFRWAALSGDPADIAATDRAILELFPEDEHLARWITKAQEKVHFEGLPARICWLGYQERHLAGLRFNEMVASGELSAPVVIGRDHLDSGSVASPYRETESMADGSDAIADWPLLNALLNTASGATWVSIHHGGGVGIGRSIHAGQVIVADGTPLAAQKIERVLVNDPGTGVMRHVDAGYERAAEVAEERGLRVPMSERGCPRERATVTGAPATEGSMTLADLHDIGRDPSTGGYRRYAWNDADMELREWFAGEAAARGMEVVEDGNGNQFAWWGSGGDALLIGSHLDSVPDGGAYDGPLGVVSSFAAVDRLAGRRCHADPADRDRQLRRRGGRAVRHRLRRIAARSPARSPPTGRWRRRIATASRWPRCSRRAAAIRALSERPTCSTRSAPSSSCTSSRAGRWCTPAMPSASPPRSGRTGAGVSTSAARPTTPAPR